DLIDGIMDVRPDVARLRVEPALAAVVSRLLEKDPRNRYGDANQVIVALSQATGQSIPIETSLTRESFLQAARFVGREAEQAQLCDLLERALVGQGSSILIGGESGVGKSRLLGELRTLAM